MNYDIYTTRCDIYGIRIYNFDNNKLTLIYERKFNTIMSDETIVETKLFYEDLYENDNDKKTIKFKIYTRCENNYNDHFMCWLTISLDYFIKKFSISYHNKCKHI